MKKRFAIFASGNGSNAENIIRYFRTHDLNGEVTLVVCNKPDARVIERSRRLDVPTQVLSRNDINNSEVILELLERYRVDVIVLAGFLLMIPRFLIQQYHNRIVNIHPSLLPKFGGKGMYGMYVHEAVVAAREHQTGITIHLVNEKYDDGRILFQATVPVNDTDTPAQVAAKVQQLESEHLPRILAATFL